MRVLLAVIGLFAGTATVAVFGGLWLMAATTPDPSRFTADVEAGVISLREELRGRPDYGGYRVGYSYRFGGTTYVADQFVKARYWPPRDLPRVCVDPTSPAEHMLRLRPTPPCGEYIAARRTASPVAGR